MDRSLPLLENGVTVLRNLSALPAAAWENPFVRRDAVDLARTVAGRFLNLALMQISVLAASDASPESRIALAGRFLNLLESLADILSLHEDYSMYQTLRELAAVCPVNPDFERTLKHNLVNGYCRQYAYEPVRFLFPQECRAALDWACLPREAREKADPSQAGAKFADHFFDTPLAEMQPGQPAAPDEVLAKAAGRLHILF